MPQGGTKKQFQVGQSTREIFCEAADKGKIPASVAKKQLSVLEKHIGQEI